MGYSCFKSITLPFFFIVSIFLYSLNASAYCPSYGESTIYEWIDKVGVNQSVNVSGNDWGYGDYTYYPPIGVSAGKVDVTLTPAWSKDPVSEHWAVWVDLDQDLIFSEAERLLSVTSAVEVQEQLQIPATAKTGPTRMRVAMSPEPLLGPCDMLISGEVEDYSLEIYPYSIRLGNDYRLIRSGETQAQVNWVIERDGIPVAMEPGWLDYTYPDNQPGSLYRAWLEADSSSTGPERVSNIIEYVPGEIPEQFELRLGNNNELARSGNSGDPVSWVIEQDGMVVLQRNASDEFNYIYFGNMPGSQYRVWLQRFINGVYQPVSNVVSYTPSFDIDLYNIELGADFEVTRSGDYGNLVNWVVEENGIIVQKTSARYQPRWTYPDHQPGGVYRIWLEQFINGKDTLVSNVVEYQVAASTDYQLAVDASYLLTRSGKVGDNPSLTWVIEKDGVIVLQRLASNELSYRYYNNTPGSQFRVWLKAFNGSTYEVVSNVVSYSVPTAYQLSVDASYLLTRSGGLGDNPTLTWVIEKDGVIVLQRLASNELSYRYYNNTPGSQFRVWLKASNGSTYEVVSNIIQYTVY